MPPIFQKGLKLGVFGKPNVNLKSFYVIFGGSHTGWCPDFDKKLLTDLCTHTQDQTWSQLFSRYQAKTFLYLSASLMCLKFHCQ